MTSIAHTSRVKWRKSSVGVDDAGRPFTLASRPRGLITVGLATVLVSAWAGIVAFVGPTFGFNATTNAPAWHWSMRHLWLHALPGAVGVAFGLVVLFGVPKAWRPRGRAVLGFAGLVLIAVGAWFVLAPPIWPIISSGAVFSHADPMTTFLTQLGYNLGPGLVLAALGGMVLKSARSDRLGKEPADTGLADLAEPPVPGPDEVPPTTATTYE